MKTSTQQQKNDLQNDFMKSQFHISNFVISGPGSNEGSPMKSIGSISPEMPGLKSNFDTNLKLQTQSSAFRPKSSYLGNPVRSINYESNIFTTDVISVDKKLDDVEDIILKYNKRQPATDKKVRIELDIKDQQQKDAEMLGMSA